MEEKIVYSDIFKTAWKGFKAQCWLLMGLFIGFIIIYSLLLIFAIPAKGETMTTSGMIVCVLSFFLSGLFQMGYLKNCFQTMDGEEPLFSAYGQESRKLLIFLVAYITFFIITSLGFLLLIIPGIYLSLRLQFYFASMVDENTGIIESLKRSWEITKGYSLKLFLLTLIIVLITFIGGITLIAGLFVAAPFVLLMYACTFRRLTTPMVKQK